MLPSVRIASFSISRIHLMSRFLSGQSAPILKRQTSLQLISRRSFQEPQHREVSTTEEPKNKWRFRWYHGVLIIVAILVAREVAPFRVLLWNTDIVIGCLKHEDKNDANICLIPKKYFFKNSDFPRKELRLGSMITMQPTKEEAFDNVSDYVYKNILPVVDENLEDTYYVAQRIKLRKLEKYLRYLLEKEPITKENALRRLELAAKMESDAFRGKDEKEAQRIKEDDILWKGAVPVFRDNQKEILQSKEWRRLEERDDRLTFCILQHLWRYISMKAHET